MSRDRSSVEWRALTRLLEAVAYVSEAHKDWRTHAGKMSDLVEARRRAELALTAIDDIIEANRPAAVA